MTNYGYKFFTFSVHKRGDSATRLRLGELQGKGATERGVSVSRADTIVTLYGLLNGLRGRRLDDKTKHLTVQSADPSGRMIKFTVDLGTSGQSSTFIDPTTGTGTRVFNRAEKHIESNQRRGLIVAPTQSTVGMVALESRSGSTGSTQTIPIFKRGFTAHTGLVIDFDAVVHEDALQAFLEQAHVGAITLRRRGLPSDIADQLEVRDNEAPLGRLELKISRGTIPEFKRGLTEKLRRNGDARQRLLSVGNLAFDELNVKMQVGDRSTTLSVSADRMPSFVYQLPASNGAPADDYFYNEVQQMVPEVADAFGAIVSGGWQTGTWSEATRATVVELPQLEVSRGKGPAGMAQ
jgi:hypothetical protein